MDDKTLELLRELAARLGTTADHLWSVLVRQAPITAATDLFVLTAAVCLTVWWAMVVAARAWEDEVYQSLAWASVAVCCLVIAVAIAANASLIVAGFANPEYWALSQLLPHKP